MREDGETGSGGQVSMQLPIRPRVTKTSPLGECGVAFKALFHCPRLEGSLALRDLNNVGFGLTISRTPTSV
jgi:hypothetical protein